MANVQYTHEKAGTAPAKKSKWKSPASQPHASVYCVLCRRSYLKQDIQEHMHGMLHHRELETLLGKNPSHECQACRESSMGLYEYAQHISTAQHEAKLKSLMSANVKPPSLMQTLGKKLVNQIMERNKMLKIRKKKEVKKKNQKQKQLAAQRRAEKLQKAPRINTGEFKVMKVGKCKKLNKRKLKQMQDAHKKGPNNAVYQNKENKVWCRGPAGPTWQRIHVQDHVSQSAQQQWPGDNFSVNCHCSKTDTSHSRPHNAQGYVPEHIAWSAVSQLDHYNNRISSATDFTSDYLPENQGIIFEQSLNESTGASQPGQEGSLCSAQPANKSVSAAPVWDVDVGEMLRQIRRALGVREPCRAEREAQKQNREAAKKGQPAGGLTQATSAAATSSTVNSHAPVSDSGFHPSKVAPAKPTYTAIEMAHGAPSQTSSVAELNDTNGPSNSGEREAQGTFISHASLSQFSGGAASSEPTRRVRIAHKPSKVLEKNATKSKLSWRETRKDVKGKNLDMAKAVPRFAVALSNPLSVQECSASAEDMPLSEGFHWESLPYSPSDTHWTGLPPQPQLPTHSESCIETQSGSQRQEPPGAAQEASCGRSVSLKVEANLQHENGDLRAHGGARERRLKRPMHDVLCEEEPGGKRKNAKSNKGNSGQERMNELLAVSLREEELSHTLEDLDDSLIQARNALQAAYTEVQRLLLLRQQCTAEVNSLRAKRIEILQGMQGEYVRESNVSEGNATSLAGTDAAAAVVQPRLVPLPSSSAFPTSSSQQLPHTHPPPSISQTHPIPLALPTMPVKQAISPALSPSCNPGAPQVPVNPPASLFPLELLPTLLFPSPDLAAPTTAAPSVDSLKQVQTESFASLNSSAELPALQLKQVTAEGIKDSVRTERQEADGDSEGGNIRRPAEKYVSTVVTKRDQDVCAAATDDSGGNKSHGSVQMMAPCSQEVIDIEETLSDVPSHQEPPQKSVSVESTSTSTQTFQQGIAQRKTEAEHQSVEDAAVPAEHADALEDEEPSLGAFENHQGPIHDLQVHEGWLYTCSGDNTARAYCLTSRECQGVFKGHTNKVNCLLVSSVPNMPIRLFTGSSDQTVRCYSIKSQKCREEISMSDRVLCLHIAWNILFSGLANGSVASYDLKTLKLLDVFECHGPRGVSCLGTAQEGARRVLLVGSYDSTISVRDAKNGLLLRTLEGHTKTVLCMKVVNDLVFSGSSDSSVHAHNIHTGELVRVYKGHSHAVTSIVILGNVMVTACLDKLVRVYELQSHDRLQVYGGHSDMVMCMAVHKSVIYTGCYDGSIQAVKLNLMKNFRCWWQNCSMIFGMTEHLVHHLTNDHTNPNLQAVNCRWRGCSSFFATQESVKQELPEHIKSHMESEMQI